jgi:hypothetical protein
MIYILSNIFRGLSFIFGISAPPPDQGQRAFVMMWLGIIVLLLGVGLALLYAMGHVHLL